MPANEKDSAGSTFPAARFGIALLAILALALWPVGLVLIASGLASAGGCALDEGSIHVCVIGGLDLGGALYAMFVSGWFMLVTIPLGALAVVVWTGWLVVSLLRWRARRP